MRAELDVKGIGIGKANLKVQEMSSKGKFSQVVDVKVKTCKKYHGML